MPEQKLGSFTIFSICFDHLVSFEQQPFHVCLEKQIICYSSKNPAWGDIGKDICHHRLLPIKLKDMFVFK